MKIIDISWPIQACMTQYKNKDVVNINPIKTFQQDLVRQTSITIDSHTGTHIDLPAHFVVDGATSSDFDLNQCCGFCTVIDLTHVQEAITQENLNNFLFEKDSIVLLKTKNSFLHGQEPFNQNFVYLEKSGAAYLAHQQIKAVGIDYLGIERNQPGHPTHKILFEHNVAIIEGLRLQHVNQGDYTLFCLPLAFTELEALPARAILHKNN